MRLPNLILVVLDTVRADRLSSYGYKLPTTPHLDSLAREGLLYESAISPAPWTLPSHASLFTGLYPSEHGAQTTTMPPPPVPTLAEVLSDAGYETIAICQNPWMGAARELQRGFQQCPDVWSRPKLSWWGRLASKASVALCLHDTGAKVTTDIVLKSLTSVSEPFFMFVNYLDAHGPSSNLRPFSVRGVTLAEALYRRLVHIVQTKRGTQWDALLRNTPRTVKLHSRMYDNDLHYLDRHFGRLERHLKESGLAGRTMVVVTADHGENLGEHNLLWHFFSLHDTLIRVPLIVRSPGVLPPNHRIAAQVQLTDLLPSLCRKLGLPLAPEVDRPHRPDLFDLERLADGQWSAYAEHVPPPLLDKWADANQDYPFDSLRRELRAVRTSTHKYIRASDGSEVLYDLTSDPGETTDLIEHDQGLARKLADKLTDWESRLLPTPPQDSDSAESEDLAERLRELGYI